MKPQLLVLGASSPIGAGVVEAAVGSGWRVAIAGPARERLQALQRRQPRDAVQVLRACACNERSAAALAGEARRLARPLAGVVAAFDLPDMRGRLLELPGAHMRRTWDAALQPHLAAARHLLPLLAADGRSGSYVLVGGPGGDRPWAAHGARSVAGAGLRMLACVLHDEARSLPVRVQLLSLDTPVREADDAGACPQWPSAEEVGRQAMALVERRDAHGRADPIVQCRPGADPASPPTTQQIPDSEPRLLTARCLQDARTLLDSIALPLPRKGVSG